MGYTVGFVSDWLKDRRASTREAVARELTSREALRERRIHFQHQALLELQEVLFQLGRTTGKMHCEDVKNSRETGQWQRELYGEDLSEENRLATVRTSLLVARISDPEIREFANRFKTLSLRVSRSSSEQESDLALHEMSVLQGALNERIGILLRSLDEAL